jgi:amino acid adenylation domain-containing protein
MGDSSPQSCADSSTLIELLRARAAECPEHRIFTFLEDGENETSFLTLAELDRQARAIGAQLQRTGVSGRRALLLFPPGLDFIAAFFGCLYAGVVAVPAYPPRSKRGLPRLLAILKDVEPSVLLADPSILRRFNNWSVQPPELITLPWITTDEIDRSLSEEWQDPESTGDTLAFLQYTSGSTAAPKGVMVSHRHALHNEELIKKVFRQTDESMVVGWLPLYHDMGLIGNVLQPLYTGARCVLMPPMAFLQKPVRWLKCISHYRATTSGGPNFAYQLCVQKITPEQCNDLALDSWKVAFNGAEPVRHETLKQFAEAFEPYGFSREAFYPCYGLAEATLLVSGRKNSNRIVFSEVTASGQKPLRRPFEEGGDGQVLVSSGQFIGSGKVIVVDPETLKPCEAGETGELWLQSISVAAGYWNKPEETERTFRAYLNDGSGDGPFLRTGDLGFLNNRDVYITGRLKDLIIIRGRNLYPQDIEFAIERSHPTLSFGAGAAFSVDVEGDERLVVVQEIESHAEINTDEIAAAARKAVAEEYEVHLHEIAFIRAGTISRTTSGKIQRYACRDMYLAGTIKVVGRSRMVSSFDELSVGLLNRETLVSLPLSEQRVALETHLQALVARALKVAPARLSRDQPLVSLGFDSLLAVELQHTVEGQLEIRLPLSMLLGGGSIATLADEALSRLTVYSTINAVAGKRPPSEYPLSHGQQALWFLHRLAPADGAYNLAVAVRIRGDLNVPALQNAFQTLTDRHPSLRTNFTTRDGRPVQWIHEHRVTCFEESDASTWDEALLNDRLADEAIRPFDLEKDPLLRVMLLRRSSRESVLMLVVHHIIADFHSFEILMRELSNLYRYNDRDDAGELAPLELLTWQYADHVRWQKQMLSSAEGKQAWEYWQRQLGGELPVLNLPADRVRPPVQSYNGSSTALNLETELTERLKLLARAQGVTFYTLLLAVFQVLLSRYTGQEDLIVGTPTTGRVSHEFGELVGYFVNPVALRANLTGNPTFEQLLKGVGPTVLEALQYQHYPFPLLVERLERARDSSHTPLFQVMFVMQKTTRPELEDLAGLALGVPGVRMQLGGLSLESVQLEQRTSQFDMTLIVTELEGSLALSLQYNTDLFDVGTVARLLAHYRNLLEGVAADPAQRILDLPLLTSDQRNQLLVEWNDTSSDFPTDQCMHELFEAQAARTPDAVALIFDGRSVNYQTLNRRANQVAHRLRAFGVAPDERVAILLERSVEMVIAILGVLKAGGAYVPLDPHYPRERIAFMLEDAKVAVVLTEERQRSLLNLPEGVRLLEVEADYEPAGVSLQNPLPVALSDNLAYIIYTSGSTGRPKGVAISHRSVVALLYWARDIFSREELRRVVGSTSICFDLSVFELFVTLSWGGAVVLVKNLLEAPSLVEPGDVTLINTVPSVLAELLRGGRFPIPVLTVNLAGEPLNPSLVDETYERMQASRVLNLYGPSEDTTYSCYAIVDRGSRNAPIGKPVTNTKVYVLDERLQPVPIGVAAELYIGGAGLARGYYGHPELTAERFIPNPFARNGGERLYRTGDLAYYLAGGELEFIGRRDNQVKIRGFRVELGEIETVLGRHSGVREAVALVREDTPGENRLVAYITPHEASELSVNELRSHLQERLPDYMLPAAFVLLETMPLTPNGKLDRSALPAPDVTAAKSFVAPRTGIEETLAGIWSELLNLERVSVSDDFFESGGHSLLAVRLTSRVRQAFDVELSLRSIFESPTISGLAILIESNRNGDSAPPIRPVSREQSYPEPQSVDAGGGIERRAPTSSGWVRLQPGTVYVAPRTVTEEILVDIWSELLNLDQVSVNDNFFESGGHSLLAARLASRVRQAFNVELSLRSVFESSTLAELAQVITTSPPVDADERPLAQISEGRSYPLSYAQQRLWFLDWLEPGSPAYNLPGALHLAGQLHVGVLKRSLDEILRRHEILRAKFINVDGQPHQIIDSISSLDMPVLDLGGWPPEERELEMRRLAKAEARAPFDLTEAPLLRATLLRLGEDEHVLLLSLHHIVADGWSLGVLAREVGALYQAFLAGTQSPLAKLPVQYVDFAVWQKKWLTDEVLEGHLAYWKGQLQGSPVLLDLPSDRPRPTVQTFRGASRTFELSAELGRRLNDLSHEGGVTLFMTLLAAFKVLLYQNTQQEDLLVGTPIANRSRLETEGLIGCFVNTLVLRTDLSGNPSFTELLGRVRKVALEAFEHQDLPFEKLVEGLQLERTLSYSPLFQVMFVMQGAPTAALELPGLSLHSLEVDSGTAKYDLTLSVAETKPLGGTLEYNTDLFDDATMARLLAHYRSLLEAVAADPGQPICELPLLTPEERHQLLVDWNDTQIVYSETASIPQLFEKLAEERPNAEALIFEEEIMTYGELNRRANQLAHHLRYLGVGPETLVGICAERSLEMVWGLLGILKAGGAYVPLDPEYPHERLSHMLEDSGVSLLLTQERLVEAIPLRSARVLLLDAQPTAWRQESEENPSCTLSPDNAAYAIYTSGSTGQPKAAVNTHRAIANRLLWMQDTYHLNEDDCVLQKTPFSFDVSVWEFFWPLLTGARLVLARPRGHLDTSYLIELIAGQRVTTIHFVPSMLQMFLQDLEVERCDSLRRVICSGEALPFSLMQSFIEKLDAQLHNLYGPTEAAVDVTFWKCERDRERRTVPIGRPIANTQIYILNPDLRPVPPGVSSELHIGGISLARGYLFRPALTAEKFIPDPFANLPGARLYKTGDKARYLADGNIEFQGRLDHQVKLRGFRIEPGEIEAALISHPAVREAVVIVRQDQPGEKRLVAYLVIKDTGEPADSDYKQFLKERLPDYMLPSAFVVLESLPLTVNGKVDRKGLPVPDRQRRGPQETYVVPRTHLEKTLADIWAYVLDIEKVGVHDNFFAVGGDSILSMKVVFNARKSGIELRPKDIYEHQTIAELAVFADTAGRQGVIENLIDVPLSSLSSPLEDEVRTSSISSLTRAGRQTADELVTEDGQIEDVYPLSPVQEGMLFHSAYSPESEMYFEQMSFTLHGKIDVDAFRRAWQELVDRHTILRTAFVWKSVSEPLQVVRRDAQLPLVKYDWRGLSRREQQDDFKKLLQADREQGFDCSVAPLLRLTLVRLAEETYALVWSHHHMLLDGWSKPLILKEFLTLYEALRLNRPTPSGRVYPFRNYVSWLRQQDLSKAEVYWRAALEGVTAPTSLTPVSKASSSSGLGNEDKPRELLTSKALTESLRDFSLQHHLTLNTLLQGAWALLLAHYSGEDDVVFGVTVSGRPTELDGAESMVGMFINTLPLRVSVPWDDELLSWLKDIQTQQAELIEYAYSPLARVQGWSDVPRGTPLFESILVFQNYPVECSLQDAIADFEIGNVRAHERTKYPLMLVVEPGAQLSLKLLYDGGRFDRFAIERMLKHLQFLLEGIAVGAGKRLASIPFLPDDERQQLLRDWNDTGAEFPDHLCVHQLFEAQARQTPESQALTFEERHLTYRELNALANRLAHHLRNLGVRSESVVGLCVERSPEMVIGLLAIFKAGGAFLPINPQYPSERVAYMIEDAEAAVLITQHDTSVVLPRGVSQVVRLDDDCEVIAGCSEEDSCNDVRPEHLAYITYTSGSTGKPNGVLVEHRNLVNTLCSSQSLFNFRRDDVVACISAFSFDIFLFELLCPLLAGGRCLLLTSQSAMDAALVRKALAEVTVIHAVPALMRQLVVALEDSATAAGGRIRQVFVGGDAVPPKLLTEIQEVFPLAGIDVLYGPTEATIICAHHAAESGKRVRHQMIGKPMQNVVLRLCDKRQNIVPVGIVGEIYIGGAGVARRYLNNEELTREKYVSIEGERYYRSGDLGWWLPDGSIAFAGRVDEQVKVRGFRIELSEVEAALGTHPAIGAAVVVARDDGHNDKRLVAYVVPRDTGAMTTSELRSYLQERLPQHMLPSVFVLLSDLPLTQHGKIDRNALPSPGQARPELRAEFVAPRTPVEEKLAEIWAQVLDLERVGIHDDFFELGGDSILSIRLIARARQREIEFTARHLFNHPTIAELVEALATTSNAEPSTKELLTHAQNRAHQLSEETLPQFQDADVTQREFDRLTAQITRNRK